MPYQHLVMPYQHSKKGGSLCFHHCRWSMRNARMQSVSQSGPVSDAQCTQVHIAKLRQDNSVLKLTCCGVARA
jgi:hypothetical protein